MSKPSRWNQTRQTRARFLWCEKLIDHDKFRYITIQPDTMDRNTKLRGIKPTNRPFPSSLVPQFQSESKCETIHMKMTLNCMKMKLHVELIFIWKVSHLDSFWKRGTRELGNGLFCSFSQSLVLRSTVLRWILTHRNWSISLSHDIAAETNSEV